MTSQNIYSLHTPAKGILSDPPSPRTSNPTPATFLLLLALQQMALSLQTMCPFRNSVLPSASSSKVSTAPHDLPPQQIQHVAAQIRIAPLWSIKKRSGEIHTSTHAADRWGGGDLYRPTFVQCMSNCPHSSYQFLLGVLMGARICPLLDLGVSN